MQGKKHNKFIYLLATRRFLNSNIYNFGYSPSSFCFLLGTTDFEHILSTIAYKIFKLCFWHFHKSCSIHLTNLLCIFYFDCIRACAVKHYLVNLLNFHPIFFFKFKLQGIMYKVVCHVS